MTVVLPLTLAAESLPERVGVQDTLEALTYAALDRLSGRLASHVRAAGVDCVAMLAQNSVAFPALFFGAAKAGVPFVPMNYRLTDAQLDRQAALLGRALLVTDPAMAGRIAPREGLAITDTRTLIEAVADLPLTDADPDPQSEACWLFTSGTTGEPKTALLSHANLTAYVFGTVDPLSATEDDAVLASVPPYHIAGLVGILSNVFAGRRVVFLDQFSAEHWVDRAASAKVTQAMVVPTMLGRILDVLAARGETLPHLRSLSYGGGRMPTDVIRAALERLPHVGFTNAYGLTETASTITLLSPADHREARLADTPEVRARLGSVGRPLPGIEIEIRKADDSPAAPTERGEIWVRGPQVSGAYRGKGPTLRDGWFNTRDEGWMDAAGYLFLAGRTDDVIVRGGENISPGEIEDTIIAMPEVADVAVVARPDREWGEVPVAFVVLRPGAALAAEAIRSRVRGALRSTRVPAEFLFVAALPYNETGKLLRAELRARLRGAA